MAMVRTVVAAMILLVLLISAATAQDPNDASAEGERLRTAGSDAFRAGQHGAAAERYTEAAAAFERAYGADSVEAAQQNVILRRAILWCRTHAGQFNRLPGGYREFLADVATVGGASAEVRSARQSVTLALETLARAKNEELVTSTWHAWRDACADAIARAKAASNASELTDFIGSLRSNTAHARYAYFEALYTLGKKDPSLVEYRAVMAYWIDGGDHEQAQWTAQNAFYEMTQTGAADDAALFVAGLLDLWQKHPHQGPISFMLVNLRNHMTALGERGEAGRTAAVTFVETAVALMHKRDIVVPGFDECQLRLMLVPLLPLADARAVTNGDALARAGKAASHPWFETRGLVLAGNGLLAAGKASDAMSRAEKAVSTAARTADPIRQGEAHVLLARCLTAAGRHDDAEAAVTRALELFDTADYARGRTEARQAGRANAKAAGDDGREEHYAAMLRRAVAGGGQPGRAFASMAPEKLVEQLRTDRRDRDLLELRRRGDNEIVVRCLLDDTEVVVPINRAFHHVNVNGVLFQMRGFELAVLNIYDGANAPGTDGESVMSSGGEVVHMGPDFAGGTTRELVPKTGSLRVTSGFRVYRAR